MKYVFLSEWISEDLDFKQPCWKARSLCCLGSFDHLSELCKDRDHVLPIFASQGPAKSLAPRKLPGRAWGPGWQALWWLISVSITSLALILAAVNTLDISCHEKTYHMVIFQLLVLNPSPWPGRWDNGALQPLYFPPFLLSFWFLFRKSFSYRSLSLSQSCRPCLPQ